jgi:serine/threonine kinase 38
MDPRQAYAKGNANYQQADDRNNQMAQQKTTTPQPMPKREVQISQSTKEKADAAKAYIERKYSKLKQEEEEKRENWELLQKKMDSVGLTVTEQELIKRDIMHKESERLRMKRKKISVKDFESIAIIGRGAFGEVRLCRWKETKEIVAMKKMNKSEMEYKNQVAHVRAERDVLASASNPWIVELKCSFQDDKFLYLVMEYLPGGDLMTLLMKRDILTEEESKYYMAEAILAVESVHKLNYIHRDLKPDNILLDAKGHIKLSDFGLCKHAEIRPRRFEFKKMDETTPINKLDTSNLTKKPQYRRNRQLAYSTVGTPDYIAPEVFGQNGYTETVDWWSLGVILFEMLVGYPPFFSEDPSMTCQKILHWRKTFVIPPEANLSPAAIDLLKRLICDPNERLGVNGVEEIKAHPFFAGVDWKRIREKKAPNVPELKSEIDTSNFDHFDEEEPLYTEDSKNRKNSRKNVNFIGYTFKRDVENQRTSLINALQDLEAHRVSQSRPKGQVMQKNQENKDPQTSTSTSNANILGPKNSTPNVVQGGGTYAQTIAQTSASNISSAISSISALNINSNTTSNPPTSNYSSNQQQRSPYVNQNSPYDMYLTNYSSTKSPTNAGAKPNIFKLPEEKERPETAYTSTEKKKIATTTTTNNMGINSPDNNVPLKKFTPTNQTPSTNKLINMNYQGGMSNNRSPIPDSNSTPNLNKGGINKYSFLNSGQNRPTGGGGGFKMNKDLMG